MTPRRPDADPLLQRLLGPAEAEVGCDACFELLDEYVEADLAGVDTARALPGMDAHLVGCPACHEDFESLRDLVRDEGKGGAR
jgi:hypothetical protein